MEFIEAYEIRKKFFSKRLKSFHSCSMLGLQTLIDKNLVSRDEVLKIINLSYKPRLKALSYILAEDGSEISIFSHAGIDIKAIEAIAKKLNVPFKDDTAFELAETIDNINTSIQIHLANNTMHTLYTELGMQKGYSNYGIDCNENPIEFLLWNRDYEGLDRNECHRNYKVEYIHGHDSDAEAQKNVTVLNSTLGSSEDNFQGSVFSRLSFNAELQAN